MRNEAKILVLMGGTSSEREVSLATGAAVVQALKSLNIDHYAYDFKGLLSDYVRVLEQGYTVVFNCLHGTYGEDGRIQAITDLMAIPYSHSGVMASAVSMNKNMSLKLFSLKNLPIANSVCCDDVDVQDLENWPLPLPLVVKPVSEGSSVGVHIFAEGASFADYRDGLLQQVKKGSLLFEEYIAGRELTVSVVQDGADLVPLAVTELFVSDGFYDYAAKYSLEGGAKHQCPADVSADIQSRCFDIAVKAHQVLGLRGVSRSDFRYDPDQDRLVLLETNSQPGMTETSLLPEQAAHYGWSFPTLIEKLLLGCAYD